MKHNLTPRGGHLFELLPLISWFAFSAAPGALPAAPADAGAGRSRSEPIVGRLSEAPGRSETAWQHYNLGPDKVALKGYDPVAYFTQSAAVRGKREFNAQHRGVTYYFASDENKKRFIGSPDKYLPTYGGWCATAMAKGEKVEIDPTNFKITNGRLFLFFKAFYANAIKDWNKDEPGQTARADANWKKISGE